MESKKQTQISLPVAIVLAGALIAGAIVLTKKAPTQTVSSGTPIEEALTTAASIGIKGKSITACIENNDTKSRVDRDIESATKLGITGTPYNVILGPNNTRFAIPGAFPIEYFEKVIAIMEAGTPRGTTTFLAEDVEGIYKYVMEKNALPTITGDKLDLLLPVDELDHVRGNKDASITIVEYSDLECPFCQVHHDTMKKLAEKQGDKIAWVYRHLPLPMHDGAAIKAQAAECAVIAKNADSFWKYVDANFASMAKR